MIMEKLDSGSTSNYNRAVFIWLLTGCFLIFVTVLVGGITRLTNSGLSMVDWHLFMGVVPPLNEADWITTFESYKQYPEYQQINFNFTLAEFKSIFFWEYLHRMIGRLIGMVFIIPFAYFIIRKKISRKLLPKCLLILLMGSFQGFVGWWMVKSGLAKNPDVSHYRLAVHLTTAFITFAYTFWVALSLRHNNQTTSFHKPILKGLKILLPILLIQIVYGAFVSGLNAGLLFNTWPKMGEHWISPAITAMKPIYLNFIEGLAGVQFIHRYLAYIVAGIVVYLWVKGRKLSVNNTQRIGLNFLLAMVTIQFTLGVFTILYGVPIWLGVSHQIGAFILLGGSVFALNAFRRVAD
jgi:cytochrome c oxidase assembly protein subunit 15